MTRLIFTALTNHLWQSTIFALAVVLVALACRKNRAQVRYWLWLSASLKFLVPFALLMSLGNIVSSALESPKVATEVAAPAFSTTVAQIAQPFSGTLSLVPAAPHSRNWLFITMLAVWACGFLAVALMRFQGLLQIRGVVRASVLIDIAAPVEVRSSPGLLEPGIVGLFHSILLLPEGILQTLSPSQLEAVVAHELAHVRRRDNLTAAVHMLVEAIFWFYPLVWWIGARLVDERERACDEAVLSLGSQPRDYADAILSVCKLYTESPLTCVSAVTGANLKNRVQTILSGGVASELTFARKAMLSIVCALAVAAPLLVGAMEPSSTPAQTQSASPKPFLSRPAAGRQSAPATVSQQARGYVPALGTVAANSVTVEPRVGGQLMSLNFKDGEAVHAGQLLATIDSGFLQQQVAAAQSQIARDQVLIDNAKARQIQPSSHPSDELVQLQAALESDQAKLDDAKLQMSYAQVVAPITGLAGFHLMEVGSFVHPGPADPLVVINEVQPIAVLFSVQEDNISALLARLKDGSNPPVEAWNREDTTEIAAGRLVALNNQIDETTGMVKLKASFENKDGALFPNEFVIVHLFLNGR
jgi:RND family efflux transporter MFP subunit